MSSRFKIVQDRRDLKGFRKVSDIKKFSGFQKVHFLSKVHLNQAGCKKREPRPPNPSETGGLEVPFEDRPRRKCRGQEDLVGQRSCFGNQPRPQELDEWAVLDTYKAQSSVEPGFQFLRSQPFLADALFWNKPAPIEGLLTLMCLSLRVYAMAQLRLRR